MTFFQTALKKDAGEHIATVIRYNAKSQTASVPTNPRIRVFQDIWKKVGPAGTTVWFMLKQAAMEPI